MINQKKIVIDKVVSKMSDRLSSDDLSLLEATLIISLEGLKIEEECTALSVNTKDWDFYISMFHANKRLNNCSENTLRLYDFAINKLRETINKNPTEIDTNDIKLFLAKYSVTPSPVTKRPPSKVYINNLKSDLSSFFKFLCDEGYIGKNPVSAIPKIKVPKIIKHAYSGEEMEKLKAAPRFYQGLIKGVTHNIGYDSLIANETLDISQREYYVCYRRFFWILDKKRR